MPRSITDQQKTMAKIELMDMFYVNCSLQFSPTIFLQT